ncbi:hypothetical protein GPX89_40320 [Nocardia sp. ET3-3]|uniref:Uncharacterized protein n=1 Tax=Nocardia terrae TaxID=2675851 RepID=A0A7K1VAF8_9NOCA|nr:hypothetical protein [Nocardia terrae]MVU83471.1 hypothetical protein [Nocardia terrae]
MDDVAASFHQVRQSLGDQPLADHFKGVNEKLDRLTDGMNDILGQLRQLSSLDQST